MAPSIDMNDIGALSDWFEDRPINKAMRAELAQCLTKRLDTVGVEWSDSSTDDVTMLDYACGPGFLSRIFAPYVSSITAIDASQMMIDRYKARIDELGGRHRNTIAIKGNLFTDPPEPLALVEENYHSFSLITVGAALHHFPDTEHAVICLVERLRPGGVLYIQDLFDDGHGDLDGKRPRGFTLDGLRSVLSSVSLVDFSFQVLPDAFEVELPSEEVLKVQFFVAKAIKPIAK